MRKSIQMEGSSNRILDDINLKNSVHTFFNKTSTFSHSIYLILICLLGLLSAGMAIVNIPVFIQTRGIIRPMAGVNLILAPVQGIIEKINVTENQFVSKGFQLIQFESEKEFLQKKLLNTELASLHQWLHDLTIITGPKNDCTNFLTDKYHIGYLVYTQQLSDFDLRINLAKTDLDRTSSLFREKFISEKEYDESALKYKSLQVDKNQLVAQKKCQWINELNDLKIREAGILKQISELNFYIEKSSIKAPSAGIIQGIRTKYAGEFCTAGTSLCSLIPDTGLLVELFIPPKDIGFISPGQKVRLLIDSYDYKYWGALQAICGSISEDVEEIENQVLYRVICKLGANPYLEHHNVRVYPGKGMTLTAQFLVDEKNLWQLLRDDIYKMVSKAPERKVE